MNHSSPLNVLFICTGNICRSPLAAQLLVAGLASSGVPAGAVTAKSRGTHAHRGAGMDELSARQSRSHGGDPAGHLSERLTPLDLSEADLVVTMTLEQRATAARMLPAASKKSVTLLELVRLIEHQPPTTEASSSQAAAEPTPVQQLERLLNKRSAMSPPRREADLDIADPYRRSAGTHLKVARQIDEAVSTLTGWLAAVLPPPHPAEAAPPAPPLTRRQARALRELDGAVSSAAGSQARPR